MQILQGFGLFVKLLESCLKDVTSFAIFFTVWVFIFGFLYQILGGDVGNASDYPTMSTQFQFVIESYRNSIGDISPPGYRYWTDRLDELTVTNSTYSHHELVLAQHVASTTAPHLMIGVIWAIWIFNQFLMLIILLNFLIAIISQSYDAVMAKATNNVYAQRCRLNRDYRIVVNFRRWFTQVPSEVLILTANSFTDESQGDEWLGFVKTIKLSVKAEVSSMRSRFGNMVKKGNRRVEAAVSENVKE
jgi:hypothetical protein